jgi:transcriptional regulator with XRE-family HTH domain
MRPIGVRTQQQVADALGISRTRVIQLERSALAKICRALDLENPYAVKRLPNGRLKRVLR